MLRDTEIQALRDGSFELTALQCTAQRRGVGADVLKGPAFIHQDPESHYLNVTLLLPGVVQALVLPATKPGELIPDDEYFTVQFYDAEGRSWVADYVLGEFSHHARSRGCTLSGRLHELTSLESAITPRAHPELRLEVFRGLQVPANAASRTEKQAGRFSVRSMQLNRVEIETPLGILEATLGEEATSIRFRGSGHFPANVESRLLEALQFVAAHHVEPGVSVLLEGKDEVTRILSRGLTPEDQQGLPPLQDNLTQSSEFVWLMFVKYFEHVCKDDALEPHPLSSAWYRVLAGEGASLETQALIYTVAVEELVKVLDFPPRDTNAVSKSQATLKEWIERTATFLKDAGMSTKLLGRFSGQLRNMLGRRAVDMLHDMAAAGMIRKEFIPQWKKLRNISAHGAVAKTPRIEDILRSRDAALVLMHQIVFTAIGYRGFFTDYSTAGWPPSTYPEGTVTLPPVQGV
jgi:hypothetical protein